MVIFEWSICKLPELLIRKNYEMSWKLPRRALRSIPKVKLASGHPLPDYNEEAVTPKNEEYINIGIQGNERNGASGFVPSLPIASQDIENNYLAKFGVTPEYDNGNDSDLDLILYSDFRETGGSSLEESGASSLSWADEFEKEETAKTQTLFDEIENALYEEGPHPIKNEEVLNECLTWKVVYPHLRTVGIKPAHMQLPSNFLILEEGSDLEDDQIIASHGSCEESTNDDDSIAEVQSSETLTVPRSGNLSERVKKAVLEQLTYYALSEAIKSFQQDECTRQSKPIQKTVSPPVEDAVSTLANISEDLGRVLLISGKPIRRSPKVLGGEFAKRTTSCELAQVIQPKRYLSRIKAIPEGKTIVTPTNTLSVCGVSKPLNADVLESKINAVDDRGFHSAADIRKSGSWSRRFSCISTEHDSLLQNKECADCSRNVSGRSRSSAKAKQISAPNTPLKLLRHLTLPPIQNLNAYNKHSSKHPVKEDSLTHIRQIFVKNKISLSPLPNRANLSKEGITELQLAKQMLESTPDSGRWSSGRKKRFSGTHNIRSRKKSTEKNPENS